ncbi:hypothetical protein ILYODFUR_031108, partial [Ilyodon furcidens]
STVHLARSYGQRRIILEPLSRVRNLGLRRFDLEPLWKTWNMDMRPGKGPSCGGSSEFMFHGEPAGEQTTHMCLCTPSLRPPLKAL